MAKTDNLGDFLKDVADSIRTKTGTTDLINAQDFSDKILSIQTGGGGNTLKNLLDATKSCYYLFNNYNGTSVDDLIQPNDTENVTTMVSMFRECTSLNSIPKLNTGNNTNMYGMFYNCGKLITIPQLNTSKVDNMNNMFYNCSSLESIPLLDTGNVINMSNMFYNCKKLTTIPLLETGKVTYMDGMFYGCSSLNTIPLYNTSEVRNMSQMFWHCNNLQTVPAFDCANVTNMNNAFASCSSLKSVLMTNIGVSLDISTSTLFERADLVTILNNLKTVTTTKTLKMGATNLAKLTDEDKAIATNKGWTLA